MPKVSIIVPVYNVEKYLEKCLDSIINQTLRDIEIICVNDGSTDGCYDILDDYMKKDNRIRVIHKQNSGYGHSINVGYEMATGEYIGIVESDDFIKSDMYETLYSYAHKYQLDLVKSNAVFLWETMGIQYSSYNKMFEEYYNRILDSNDRELMYKFFMNTWTGIYKKSFLEKYHIKHNTTQGASYQDNGFWMQTLAFCERAMWLKDAFYYYRQDNPMASIKSKSKVYAMSDEYEYVFDILKEKAGDKEKAICLYFKLFRHRGNFLRIEDTLKREFCNKVIDDYLKYKNYIVKNNELVKWFEWISNDPDEACEFIIQKKKKIMNSLQQADKIVIYGAGKRAQATVTRLYNLNMYNKIASVVVTEKKGQEKLGNLKISNIDDFHNYSENTLFIVGVSENTEAYNDIIMELKKRNINNYTNSFDLVSYFYSVG